MKSFVNYLAESQRTYDYRIKVCGDLPMDVMKQIRAKLDQFDPARIGDVKTTQCRPYPRTFLTSATSA